MEYGSGGRRAGGQVDRCLDTCDLTTTWRPNTVTHFTEKLAVAILPFYFLVWNK